MFCGIEKRRVGIRRQPATAAYWVCQDLANMGMCIGTGCKTDRLCLGQRANKLDHVPWCSRERRGSSNRNCSIIRI